MVAGDQRLTWAELDAAVDRAAAGYAALGLAPGDRVAVQLPNGVAWLRAALGALRAGLVVVPVNTAYTDPELEYVLGDSGAALLVAATRAARRSAGVPRLRRTAGRRRPAAGGARRPGGAGLPGLHQRHDRAARAARC